MKNIVKLWTLLLLISSCNSKTQTEIEIVEARKIMTLLYNKESSIQFPPPSIDEMKKGNIKAAEANSTNIDSVKYVIIQDCIQYELNNLPIDKVAKEYRELFTAYNKDKGKCFVSDFGARDMKGNEIPLVNNDFSKEALKRVKKAHKVLGIVFYSPIVFSQDNKKALVCFGATREGLDSSMSVFYLEKRNGEWSIHGSRILVVS